MGAEFFVIRDTREHDQHGWTFQARSPCLGTKTRALKTGDYSVEGFEDRFAIERKRNAAELAGCLFQSRFHRELDRLDLFEHPYVFLEFSMEDLVNFPVNSGIPKSKWRHLKVRAPLLVKTFWETSLAHPRIHWHFVGDCGQQFASSLFKRIVEQHGTKA